MSGNSHNIWMSAEAQSRNRNTSQDEQTAELRDANIGSEESMFPDNTEFYNWASSLSLILEKMLMVLGKRLTVKQKM